MTAPTVELNLDDLPADIPSNIIEVLVANCSYVARELVGPAAIGLRFMRFRPARELRDTLTVAERIAVARNNAIDERAMPTDWDRPTEEETVRDDPTCDHLRACLRVHDGRAGNAGCPPGYTMPPYPIRTSDRDALLADASEKLLAAAHRTLPGAIEGWSWQPSVAIEDGTLVVRFTPRNRHRPTEEELAPPAEDPAVAEERRRAQEEAELAAAAARATAERARLAGIEEERKAEEAALLAAAAGTPINGPPVDDGKVGPPAPASETATEVPGPVSEETTPPNG